MRKQSKDLIPIGTLEFTKTSIKKEIGSLTMTYYYDSILKIEAEKYLRDLSISGNDSGSFTFTIKITNKDLSIGNFIISNRSTDFSQRIQFTDTFKTIKSLTGLEMTLK
jgi:hypothetical protein